MQNKKENSLMNIFVYFLIVILILLIIAPPVTRIFFKKEKTNNNINSNNIKNATALICRKETTVGTMIYNITVTSNYANNILNKVTFNYELPKMPDTTVTDNPVITEINNIRNTGIVEETSTEKSTIFILTKENKEKNPTNTSLDSFFQPLKEQKANLESLGYTCQSLTA